MTKNNQKVQWQIDKDNYGKFLNQEIANIVIDKDGYAFGSWRDKLVGSFSINNGTWFVM